MQVHSDFDHVLEDFVSLFVEVFVARSSFFVFGFLRVLSVVVDEDDIRVASAFRLLRQVLVGGIDGGASTGRHPFQGAPIWPGPGQAGNLQRGETCLKLGNSRGEKRDSNSETPEGRNVTQTRHPMRTNNPFDQEEQPCAEDAVDPDPTATFLDRHIHLAHNQYLPILKTNLEYLRHTNLLADVKILTQDRQTLFAHKIVLYLVYG